MRNLRLYKDISGYYVIINSKKYRINNKDINKKLQKKIYNVIKKKYRKPRKKYYSRGFNLLNVREVPKPPGVGKDKPLQFREIERDRLAQDKDLKEKELAIKEKELALKYRPFYNKEFIKNANGLPQIEASPAIIEESQGVEEKREDRDAYAQYMLDVDNVVKKLNKILYDLDKWKGGGRNGKLYNYLLQIDYNPDEHKDEFNYNRISKKFNVSEMREKIKELVLDEIDRLTRGKSENRAEVFNESFISGSGKKTKATQGIPLYDSELIEMLSNYDFFTGVCMRDEINDMMTQNMNADKFGFIYNTSTKPPGKHWVAVWCDNDPETAQICHYNSMGNPIDPDVEKILKKYAEGQTYMCKLKNNFIQHQPNDSVRCGFHCVRFLLKMNDTNDFIAATEYNESVVEKMEENFRKPFEFI